MFDWVLGTFLQKSILIKESIILRKKCPYSELFQSVFSWIWTEYSVQMRETADQNSSEDGHFSRSVELVW